MALCGKGDQSLFDPIMAQFTYTYMYTQPSPNGITYHCELHNSTAHLSYKNKSKNKALHSWPFLWESDPIEHIYLSRILM